MGNSVAGKSNFSAATKFSVLSIIILEYTITTTTPALGAIRAMMAAEGVSDVLVKQIQSLPSLTMIVLALLAPVLEKFAKKKTLLIIAGFLMLVAGVFPAFLGTNIYGILVCRALFGAARGIIFPYAMAFIVELFDGKERDNMMGYRSTVANIAGIVFLQLGGILATYAPNPNYAFFGVLLMVPFLILIIIKLPQPEIVNAEKLAAIKAAEAQSEKITKGRYTGKTWFMIIGNMIFMFFTYAFMTDVAIIIGVKELGTAQMSGNVFTTFSALSAVAGFLFGRVIRPVFKRFAICLGMAFLAVVFILISNVDKLGISGMFAAGVCMGIGFSIYNVAIYLDLPKTVHPKAAGQVLSLFMAFNAFGQFISPNIMQWLANAIGIGDNVLHGPIIAWPVLAAVTVVCIIVKAVKKPGIDYYDKVLAETGGATAAPAPAEATEGDEA